MQHSTANMPFFIKPSENLSTDNKIESYEQAMNELNLLLKEEKDVILKMSTINSVLKTHLPYFYWVGFYLVKNGRLSVGPYQGTLGCLHIDIGRGVCGQVALSKQTKIVDDVHQLVQGTEHIACDPNSKSEIVVPVFNSNDELIAVFDVDSTLTCSFDNIDQNYIEKIMVMFFKDQNN